ncbi:MAG: glycosyltransferase family 39 protein [Dehalococcoidia bacterium]
MTNATLQRIPRWLAQPYLWLAVILIVAAVVRVSWVAYAARAPQGLHDPSFFLLFGSQIADGHGYRLFTVEEFKEIAPVAAKLAISRGDPLPNGEPTAYYPVGYPAALGGVFALVKHTPIPDNLVLAGAYFNVFLGVATVGLVYVLGWRLFRPTVGLVAAAWLAIFPNIVFHTAPLLTETLFNFLVVAALAVLLSANWNERRLPPVRLVSFGVLLGLSVLVRPVSAPFLPALGFALVLHGWGWRRALGYVALATVAAISVIAPWTVRNIIVMHSPIVLSANFGDNLCIGHNPSAQGHFSFASFDTADYCNFAPAAYAGLPRNEAEVQRDSDNRRFAVAFARTHIGDELKLLSRKAWYLWADNDHDGLWAAESYGVDPFIDPDLRTALGQMADSYFYFTISAGGLGLILWFVAARLQGDRFTFSPRMPDERVLFFVLALLSLAGVPLVFFGDARFHVPVLPLLVVPAAWLVVSTLQSAVRLALRQESGEEVAEGRASMTENDAL